LVEENLAEEETPGRTHAQLWREFAAAVGVSAEGLAGRPTLDGVQALVDTYARICGHGTVGEAVAALYVYEAQVPEVSAKKIEGLRLWYGVSEASGLAYFAVHEEADVRHRAAWRGWLAARAAEERGDLLAAGEEALRALWGALDSIHAVPIPAVTP
jgi:pyrroloquinoline-quinone synthase